MTEQTISALASKYGVHRDTLHKALAAEKFPARRSGGILLVDDETEAFQAWLAGGAIGRPRSSAHQEMQEMIALRSRILGYARQITAYNVADGKFPAEHVVGGLLPLDDVEVDGKRFKGRLTKLAEEQQEFREKLPAYLANPCLEMKVPLLHEIADVVYNEVQALYLQDASVVSDVLNSYRVYGIERGEVIAALDANFASRAAGPDTKDVEREYGLIRQALEAHT